MQTAQPLCCSCVRQARTWQVLGLRQRGCPPHSMLRRTFVVCKGCRLVSLNCGVGVNEKYLDLLLPVLPLKSARAVPSVVPLPQCNVQLQGQGVQSALGCWQVVRLGQFTPFLMPAAGWGSGRAASGAKDICGPGDHWNALRTCWLMCSQGRAGCSQRSAKAKTVASAGFSSSGLCRAMTWQACLLPQSSTPGGQVRGSRAGCRGCTSPARPGSPRLSSTRHNLQARGWLGSCIAACDNMDAARHCSTSMETLAVRTGHPAHGHNYAGRQTHQWMPAQGVQGGR